METQQADTKDRTELNQRGAGFISAIVSLVFGIIIALLALRFIFRLFGANPASAFVDWIYSASAPLVAPFMGMFNTTVNLSTGRLEFETLVAIVVYGIVAAIVLGILSWGDRHRHVV